MRRIILIAVTCIALAACTKSEINTPAFKKGQVVTISASANMNANTKVTGTDDGTTINFTWDEGDKILVTVGGKSAEFTLKTGAGTNSATFEGTLPEDAKVGDAFTVQYPTTTPDLSNQEYLEGKLPKNKMLFTGNGTLSTESNSVTFEAQYAALQLNLWTDGTSAMGAGLSGWIYHITKIDVTLGSDKYTLHGKADTTWIMNISIVSFNSIALPQSEAEAKPFLMVVPAGTSAMSVTTDAVNQNTLAASSVALSAGQCLNMPAKLVHMMNAQVIPQYPGGAPSSYSSLEKPVYPPKGTTLDAYYAERAAGDSYATYDSANCRLTFTYAGGTVTYTINPIDFTMTTPLEEHKTYYTNMVKVIP